MQCVEPQKMFRQVHCVCDRSLLLNLAVLDMVLTCSLDFENGKPCAGLGAWSSPVVLSTWRRSWHGILAYTWRCGTRTGERQEGCGGMWHKER